MRIVFAALAVTRLIETNTGWSIKKFVRTARRYRTIEIRPANKSCSPKTRFPMTSATPSPSSHDQRAAITRSTGGTAH
jgi:hypothetical protein